MTEDDQLRRMAMLIRFDPGAPDTWPRTILQRLIQIERRHGRDALMREIHKLMTRPNPSQVGED
jgi:hypothetical protein